MIMVDGSYLEGGGQILRTAVALSAITGKPCKITDIRSGRKNPGLQAQHLKGIEAAAMLCDAETKGVEIGSQTVEFYPKKIKGGKFSIDIGTAGSITLVLQTLVPICLCAEKESELEITGGTDVSWSPTTTYFQHIFCDFLERMGVKIRIDTTKYGFYPKGGGKVKVSIIPNRKLTPLSLVERGELEGVDIWSIASDFLKKANVAERQVEGAKKIFMSFGKTNVMYVQTLSPGSSVHIHSHYKNCKIGATILGEIGRPAEKVGEDCAILLEDQMDSDGCLDEWMADQILPYMALAGGSKVSVAEVTDHCQTNIWVIEKFLDVKFEVRGNLISC